MDRRSGLKKAHFSSVPIRMSLFTCKKYVFLIEKNFPNLTTSVPHPKIGKTQHNALYESRWKTQHNALYESRWKTQHNALYESRWKTQHNALYESRWKTQHNALYESRCGVGTKFCRGFVVTSTDLY